MSLQKDKRAGQSQAKREQPGGVSLCARLTHRSGATADSVDSQECVAVSTGANTSLDSGVLALTRGLVEIAGCVRKNNTRLSYSAEFKALIVEIRELSKLSWSELSEMTQVPADTLRGFKETALITRKTGLCDEYIKMRDRWNSAPSGAKRTLGVFVNWLMSEFQDEAFCTYRVREILLDLGLHVPRGSKPKKTKLDTRKTSALTHCGKVMAKSWMSSSMASSIDLSVSGSLTRVQL